MSYDADEYRAQSLATWSEMAAGWQDRRDWMLSVTGLVNRWLEDRTDPQSGQTVLDVASGTGDLGFAIAQRVGAGGRVISSDFSPSMNEMARRNGEALGLTNVEYRVLDAERMDLGDDSVDAVVCRWGYMLMADPAAALSETRRVLRPGGSLAFAVWMSPDRNPWASAPAMTLMQRGHMAPPVPGAPGIFALGDPVRITELVTGAGFAEPALEEIPFAFRYPAFDDVWDALTRIAGPLAHILNALPGDELDATKSAVREAVEPFRAADGSYSVPAATWGVTTR